VAPTLAILTLARLLMGLGGCAGLVISRAVVRDCFAGVALARSFSVISSVSMLAPLVAPALGAVVLRFAAWQVMFLVMAAFGIACLLAAAALPETHPSHHRSDHGVVDTVRGYVALLGQRRFLVPASIFALAGGTLLTYISSSSVVFMGSYGVSPAGFALVFALMAACFIGGLRLNMRLVQHHPVHQLLRAYLGVAVVALVALVALLALHAPVVAVLAALGVVKACLGGTFPNAAAETMEPFARNAGSASAMLGTLQFGFAGLVGTLLASLAFTPALEMSVTMLVLAVLASLVAAVRR
jgi:DHA1 family bicyclomycin/chloramphenicol resistance-like MFS transporter